MIAQELISRELKPLKTSDTGLKALSMMEEYKISHLPIVNNVEFLGLISERDILDMNAPEEALGAHHLSLIRPYITESQHMYDVVRLISALKLSLVPVLSEENHYLGVIFMSNLVLSFDEMASISEPGGIVVLEVDINDYSLSEISRIVEASDAKILSSYITSRNDATKIEVTLKINKTELTPVIKTFRRFEYNVLSSFHENEHLEDLQNRFESFMKFINI